MARTPWLSVLKQLIQRNRIQSRITGRGVPPQLISHERRDFLAASLAVSATLTAPGWAHARQTPTVAIVGGGIAGLSCALTLADLGIRSTVYEASHRIGGRMFSNTHYWDAGQVSEWGGELIDSGHRTMRNLAQRFSLPLDDLLAGEAAGSQDTNFFDGAYYLREVTVADFSKLIDALDADLLAAGYPTQWNAYTAAGYQLDHLSVSDWIRSRVAGGLGSPLGQLLYIAYATEYGADPQDQSALNLLYLLGYQPNPNGFAAFGESDERYHIRGGNEQLPRAMAQHLAGAGVCFEYGNRLVRISQSPGRRYCLVFDRTGAATREITADYVVLAIPFAVLRRIDYTNAQFDQRKHVAIEQLGRGRNAKLQLQCVNRFWREPGPWPTRSNGNSFSDAGYQSSWEVTRSQPGVPGILNFFSGGQAASAVHSQRAFATARDAHVVDDAQNVIHQAQRVFPGLSGAWNGKATLSLPHKSKLFRASYAYYRVGQYTQFAGYEGVRQGRVFFCGEHTSTDFQGFMEGGAREGRRVGKQLAKEI